MNRATGLGPSALRHGEPMTKQGMRPSGQSWCCHRQKADRNARYRATDKGREADWRRYKRSLGARVEAKGARIEELQATLGTEFNLTPEAVEAALRTLMG